MVRNIFTLSLLGLRDWLIQRVSALIIGLYALLIIGFVMLHPQLQFIEWQQFFSYNVVKIFSFLVLFSIILHAWIGMWTVFTDYIKSWHFRLILQVLIAILFFCCLVWGVIILWGF